MDFEVPLNRLKFGQEDGAGINARVTGRKDGIEELAANINARGQIENLVQARCGRAETHHQNQREEKALRESIRGHHSMTAETHDGVVAFRPLTPGRVAVMLGSVQVGEISPVHDPRSRYPVCFRIDLPLASTRPWQPARDQADAERQAIDKINDWLNAADLRPNGTR